MTDSTPDQSTVGEDDVPTCSSCGDPVVLADHRVLTWILDDEVRHRHFCDEDCLADWDE